MNQKVDVIKYIKSDVYRYYGKTFFVSILGHYLRDPLIRFHVAFRMKQGDGVIKFFGSILWKLNRTKRTIQLLPETKVGYGLYIGHGGPVVVNPTAVIGNNVNLSQFTTIGAGSVITKNIPDDATACGNYAKVINYNNPGRYINNRWMDIS